MLKLIVARCLVLILLSCFFFGACAPVPVKPTLASETVATEPESESPAFNLDDYQGQVVMLNFWATWCPHCQSEIPDFNNLHSKYAEQGLTILGLALDEAVPSEIMSQSAQLNVAYPVFAGETSQQMADKMGGVGAYPTTFLIDRQGRVVKKITGVISRSAWETELKGLL